MRAGPRKVPQAVAQAAQPGAEQTPRPGAASGCSLRISASVSTRACQSRPGSRRQRRLAQLDHPAHALDPGRRCADPPQGRVVLAWPVRRSRACSRNGGAARPNRCVARTRRGRRGRRRPAAVRGPRRGSPASPGSPRTSRRAASAARRPRRAPPRRGRGRPGARSAAVVRRSQSASNTSAGSARKPGNRSCTSSSQPHAGGAASSSAGAGPGPRSARRPPSSPVRRGRPVGAATRSGSTRTSTSTEVCGSRSPCAVSTGPLMNSTRASTSRAARSTSACSRAHGLGEAMARRCPLRPARRRVTRRT